MSVFNLVVLLQAKCDYSSDKVSTYQNFNEKLWLVQGAFVQTQ